MTTHTTVGGKSEARKCVVRCGDEAVTVPSGRVWVMVLLIVLCAQAVQAAPSSHLTPHPLRQSHNAAPGLRMSSVHKRQAEQSAQDQEKEAGDHAVATVTVPGDAAGKESEKNVSVSTEDELSKSSNESQQPMDVKPISTDALIRGFYVFVGIGTIVLVYIVIKLIRLRRRRAARKYRVLSHSDDQEMFPLAADDGEDEEIYNAADHHTLK